MPGTLISRRQTGSALTSFSRSMRVLFDQNIPRSLRQFLPGHDIHTAAEMGWSALSNGLILDAAEAAGFHVMITADRNMQHQQNMTGRRIAVLIVSNNQSHAAT